MSAGIRRLVVVWAALMAMLAATVGIAYLPLGDVWHVALGYGISILKTVLILWFFMEMRREDGIARIAAGAAFLWLTFLFVLTASDYWTRSG